MTNVSRRKLPKKKWGKMYHAFIDCIDPLSKNAWESPLSDLLTGAEKVMLAKRFTIILLTLEEFSSYRICKLLDVSPDTVLRTQKLWDRGKYRNIEKHLANKKDRESFLGVVGDILLLGGLVMPMAGEGRNDWLKRIDKRRR